MSNSVANKDEKDWRRATRPSKPLKRAAAARHTLTGAEFLKRELSSKVTKKINAKSVGLYHDDPIGFATNVIGRDLTDYQESLMLDVLANGCTTKVYSRSVGSTFVLSLIGLWWLQCRGPNSCVMMTSPGKVLTMGDGGLWDGVRQHVKKSKIRLGGTITDNIYDISEAWYGVAFSSSEAEKFLGNEHKNMLIIVDAADRYPDEALEHISEVASVNDAKVLIVGRSRESGMWASMSRDSEVVKADRSPSWDDKAKVPGLVSRERAELWTGQASDEFELKNWIECEPYDPPPSVLAKSVDGGRVGGSEVARKIRAEAAGSIDQKIVRMRHANLSVTKFAEERLWVRNKSGKVVKFGVWPLQRRYKAMKRLGRSRGYSKFILLKYRRGGFTTFEQAESYKVAVTQRNARCLTLAHQEDATTEIFQISVRYQLNDPYAPPIKGVGNARKLIFPSLDSSYFTATASGNAPGRGDTLTRVHGSEVSKWCRGPSQAMLVADLMSGFTEACSDPEGEDGEIVMESTPFGIDGWFAPTYKDAKKGLNDWFPIFLPWFLDPMNKSADGDYSEEETIETLSQEEKNLIERVAEEWHRGVTMAQIAWRRAKIRSLGVLFKQEYPEDDETCFLTSGTAFFPIEYVMKVLERLIRRYKREAVPGGVICIAKKPKRGHMYVAGSDTSEGIKGGDPANICIMDKKTGEQVAWAYGLWRPEKLAEIGAELCTKYNRAKWGIERQNHGHAVIQAVKRLGYRNLFKFDGKRPGWDTNSSTRPVLLDEMRIFVEENPDMINDDVFLGELLTFKLQSTGKFGADAGCHDDTIFGWGIANQLRSRGSTPSMITG